MLFAALLAFCFTARAESIFSPSRYALDSIAAWGKFPRFCVNTYRWGDKFFNTYDSTYVVGSGKRWNVKFKADSWLDMYDFRFVTDAYRMAMVSRPSTTAGFYLTYMAVSVGYDKNLSQYFGGASEGRKRFTTQFNCSLFTAEFQYITNTVGTTIVRMGEPDNVHGVHIPFRGIDNTQWNCNLYYFFNHKRYSSAAAFYYSKLQVKSSGSMYAGVQVSGNSYNFDFSKIDADMTPRLPESWGESYHVKNLNYALKIGYAYNWVFHPGWVCGMAVAPTFGIRKGYINIPGETGNSFAMTGQLRLSLVYNYNKRWFFGMVGRADSNLVHDMEHALVASNFTLEASAGFRFDLW